MRTEEVTKQNIQDLSDAEIKDLYNRSVQQLRKVMSVINKEAESRSLILKQKDIGDIFDISKPYPNEHSARIADPDQFDRIRRKNDEFGAGIDVIYGIKDNKSSVQAIRFDKTKFSVAEAKAWLDAHDYKPIKFEAAVEKARGEGQGVGGELQGDGGASQCECPKCGAIIEHKKGMPCSEVKCPKCGAAMVGKEVVKVYNHESMTRIFKVDEREHIIYCVVYRANEIDAQGDWMNEKTIYKAMVGFMKNKPKFKIMHADEAYDDIVLIENAQLLADVPEFELKKGDWVQAYYIGNNEALIKMVDEGKFTGVSIGGRAQGVMGMPPAS